MLLWVGDVIGASDGRLLSFDVLPEDGRRRSGRNGAERSVLRIDANRGRVLSRKKRQVYR